EEITNGVQGINHCSKHIVYAGGTDKKGNPKDTRTEAQKATMTNIVRDFVGKHPQVQVAGHYHFANKACPSFDVPQWLRSIGIEERNIYQSVKKQLAQFTDDEFEHWASEITKLQSKSDKELYSAIGNSLYDGGLSVSNSTNRFVLIEPRKETVSDGRLSFMQSLQHVANAGAKQKPAPNAAKEGESFFKRLKTIICTDPQIVALFTGDSLTDYLKTGIPILLTLLGITALSPWAAGLIAATIALIAKIGFKMYCSGCVLQ
ncbi:MAG: hypothetical protein LBC40_02735, partial [Dysgonamonadaceae bacterium]|nr:hypothetical protein [Dysgonamonadaceae bacterium]